MKNLSLFVSAFALCASTSYAAIDCSTLPTCEDLGYNDIIANCPSSSEVLKCPFDITKGKCTKGPSVGDLKYSLNTSNHNGWILCSGQSLNKTRYAALYQIIGTNYGGSGDNFNVPDYRGFFLRAYGTASVNNALSSFGGSANSSLNTPQKEQLPNITGKALPDSTTADTLQATFSGALYYHNSGIRGAAAEDWRTDVVHGFGFDASKTEGTGKGVYKDYGHVIPANYAANIFIYAGADVGAGFHCNSCQIGFMGPDGATAKCPACGSSEHVIKLSH